MTDNSEQISSISYLTIFLLLVVGAASAYGSYQLYESIEANKLALQQVELQRESLQAEVAKQAELIDVQSTRIKNLYADQLHLKQTVAKLSTPEPTTLVANKPTKPAIKPQSKQPEQESTVSTSNDVRKKISLPETIDPKDDVRIKIKPKKEVTEKSDAPPKPTADPKEKTSPTTPKVEPREPSQYADMIDAIVSYTALDGLDYSGFEKQTSVFLFPHTENDKQLFAVHGSAAFVIVPEEDLIRRIDFSPDNLLSEQYSQDYHQKVRSAIRESNEKYRSEIEALVMNQIQDEIKTLQKTSLSGTVSVDIEDIQFNENTIFPTFFICNVNLKSGQNLMSMEVNIEYSQLPVLQRLSRWK